MTMSSYERTRQEILEDMRKLEADMEKTRREIEATRKKIWGEDKPKVKRVIIIEVEA